MPELLVLPNTEANSFYSSSKLSGENAGFDLFLPNDVEFAPKECKMVSMGVRAVIVGDVEDAEKKIPDHFWLLPRSSISKLGLMMMNSVGVIDRSYRGELIAALWNTRNEPVSVKKGQRLVQIVTRDMSDITQLTVVDSLPDTVRGEGGFGSTGL
jgi:dUTP pyrophosphatase